MLNKFGVKNFRSFVEESSIDLKPITVFVGKNSSGKSSMLRTFPLFRQSVEENKTGPILWYGNYVDFGDFSDVITKNTTSDTIEFHFQLDINEGYTERSRYYRYRISSRERIKPDIRLVVSSKNKKTRTREVHVKFNDVTYIISIDDSDNAKLIIKCGEILIEKDDLLAKNLGQFIPTIISKKSEETTQKVYFSPAGYVVRKSIKESDILEKAMIDSILKNLSPYFHPKTLESKILDNIRRIGLVNLTDLPELLRYVFRDQRQFCKNLKDKENEIVGSIYPYLIGLNINFINEVLNNALNEIYSSVKYIYPLRATSERFYRFQDLQINEIDHKGSNLAMLLNSLKPAEKQKFEKWTFENFSFFVRVKPDGAHYAVTIVTKEDNNENEINISDMGFGYSQVVPIITAIWLEIERKDNRHNKQIFFVIEQPELHLHPAYQRDLAIVFAKVVSKSKDENLNLKIIFETHSQSMIEALGECIENEKININNDDISVLIFNKEKNNSTKIIKSHFDEYGTLINWPIGFFSGEY
ncbi:hypothetical protein SOASR015_37620 [Pectobacterium carotovorum subsp. carotovorum]|nr:hypothetical protein SOASR015_37620 [Pectobacterium carotovorum subsp. carotovorum]GLX58534.1 hypothetical protein Pcaca02_38430 [Pectobacterium carotovorum subsp. carotovorum]